MAEENKKRLGTRGIVRLVSYTAALIVALSVSAISGYTLANKHRTEIEYGYQRALGELNEYLGNLDITLQKGRYATTSNQLEGLSTKLWRDAGYAKSALELLPVSGDELQSTYRFLSQVGNFCMTLSERVSEGGTLTDEERENMRQLASYASDLSTRIAEMESGLAAGELHFGEVAAAMGNLKNADADELSDMDRGFLELEEGFEDYPTLIYDGPFSDHILQQKPKSLQGAAEITAEQAKEKAEAFTGRSGAQNDGETGGNLPCYRISLGDASMTVTKAGGRVASFVDPRVINEAGLDFDRALDMGRQAMERLGMTGFAESYYSFNNGVLTINYAYAPDGVVFYPDLVKVGIAMDNGDMVAFDATGYIMNHTARDLPATSVTEEEARAKLSPNLTVESEGRLAVIPSEGLREITCYEFNCTGDDGEQVLVYVNIETGLEEQILILLRDDTGVLVM